MPGAPSRRRAGSEGSEERDADLRRSRRVEVRESRHGRELIVDGTFASFYEPGSAVTGSVWDAIAAPVLALPPERRRAFLLLGLGGGSAARILRAIAPRARIVGVEIDRAVIREARRWFDLDALGVEIIEDDALRVLERERRRFDAIFDDVFIGRGDAVHKPAWIPDPAHGLARKRLREGGLLVANTIDESEFVLASHVAHFERVVQIEIDEYDNRILAGGPAPLSARALRRAIAADPILAPSLPVLSLRTRSGRVRSAGGRGR